MKKFFGVGTLIVTGALVACSPAQQQAACVKDNLVQPIAAATLAALVPSTDSAVALDTGVIHPAIQAYCAQLNASAVVVAPSK